MDIEVHDLILVEGALGPGVRAAIFVQGCTLACQGCFNQKTHVAGDGERLRVPEIVAWVRASGVRSVTLTGGEPTDQTVAITELTRLLRREGVDSIILYSGRRLDEIFALTDGRELLENVDVLIDGRFEKDRIESDLLRGSANQEIYLLTDRHNAEEFTQRSGALVVRDGGIVALGFGAPLTARSWRGTGC